MRFAIQTEGERATEDFAARLSDFLREGDILLLYGQMGAGKTAFVRGLARGLGSGAGVSSPTFALMHLYEGGRLPLNHFDLYRLATQQEAEDLDIEGEARGCATAVEWPQIAGDRLKEAARLSVWIKADDEGGDRRRIEVFGLEGEEWDALSGA